MNDMIVKVGQSVIGRIAWGVVGPAYRIPVGQEWNWERGNPKWHISSCSAGSSELCSGPMDHL